MGGGHHDHGVTHIDKAIEESIANSVNPRGYVVKNGRTFLTAFTNPPHLGMSVGLKRFLLVTQGAAFGWTVVSWLLFGKVFIPTPHVAHGKGGEHH